MSDDLDELEEALRANGWASPTATTLLSAADEAVAAKIVGRTNARRLVTTQRGRRARMVRTQEVYAVENSQGWIVGAVEGGRRRVLGEGLDADRRDQALAKAREFGFTTVVHHNQVRHRERTSGPVSRYWWLDEQQERPPAKPNAGPSKKLAMLQQLKSFKLG